MLDICVDVLDQISTRLHGTASQKTVIFITLCINFLVLCANNVQSTVEQFILTVNY